LKEVDILKLKKGSASPFKLELKSKKECSSEGSPIVHKYGKGHICTTDGVGYATPRNRSPLELVVDNSEGFIPLWDMNVVLRWKFDENSLSTFSNKEEIKDYVREIFGEALLKWGEADPVKFSENSNGWDFKLRVEAGDNCDLRGCTLARAFFPGSGRNDLFLFPKMFEQSRKEQVDTMIHEIGHVFGLRHFFASVRERAWPSEVFGEHNAFSIMNYGELSELTADDKNDLSLLYQLAWADDLPEINGTPIKLMTPFHETSWL